MSKSVQELIAEARLEEAIKLLKGMSTYAEDKQFENQIIMISGRLSRNRNSENMNIISLDAAMRERNQIAHALLGLADRYDIGGATQPNIPPIAEEDEVPLSSKKILFLASDPRDVGKIQMEQECVKIQAQLGDHPATFHLKIHFDPRADTLTKTMLEERPAIVHFSGHGVGEIPNVHMAGIILQNRDRNPYVLPTAALANMFRLLSQRIDFEVVLLNACESTEQAKAISKCGCHAIGMTEEIPDNAAITFASGFYLGLVEAPEDIPFAFSMAKNSLMMEGVTIDGLPRLYKDGEEVVVL